MSNLPLGLAAAMATVLVVAGCSSGRGAKVLPPPVPVVAAKTVSDKPTVGKQRVTTSARFVLVGGVWPEAKGPLAFLADDAALRAGTITLTKAQADAALGEMTRLTGAEVKSTMTASQASGNPARFAIGLVRDPKSRRVTSGVGISVGGNALEPTSDDAKVEMGVCPQVTADGSIQLDATVRVVTFEGFIEYTGDVSISGGVTVKVPAGFYQSIFSESAVTGRVRMRSGETIVLRGDGKKTFRSPDDVSKLAKSGKTPVDETLLVFLTAAVEPAGL